MQFYRGLVVGLLEVGWLHLADLWHVDRFRYNLVQDEPAYLGFLTHRTLGYCEFCTPHTHRAVQQIVLMQTHQVTPTKLQQVLVILSDASMKPPLCPLNLTHCSGCKMLQKLPVVNVAALMKNFSGARSLQIQSCTFPSLGCMWTKGNHSSGFCTLSVRTGKYFLGYDLVK
ncbi:hypothetical protein CHARACLAT_001936 [Characodon lateralis]|uniref:Secreted protein n=1 Tax=Characodon lateralis TaxID=208331 RepID=A0ABU7ERB9_9TELE|nr:hypothetical protein [Characodon lateralis]